MGALWGRAAKVKECGFPGDSSFPREQTRSFSHVHGMENVFRGLQIKV